MSDETSLSDETVPVTPADALIDQWFFESFHASGVAQSTQTWNAVRAAVDDLKRRLAPLFDQPPA